MKLDSILRLTQGQLKRALETELKCLGYKPVVKKGFLYAEGKLPVLLVAHLDTVHVNPPTVICRSDDKRYILSPQGIGGDDRCGVYMIMQIIRKHQCHVLFTQDEEVGGIGASLFAQSSIVPDVNFIIELDRQGIKDSVYYDNRNRAFESFINSFGFITATGSFSDISIIAPALNISAVNLSSGYFNAHTLHEYIDMCAVNRNIERVCRIAASKTDRFEYVEAPRKVFVPYEEAALMNVEDGYVIASDGRVIDGYDCCIDRFGNVYEYDYFDCDVYPIDGTAYSAQGVVLRYDENKAECFCGY